MRRLATAACAAAVLAVLGGTARAQGAALADPGQIELITGEVVKGKLLERYWLQKDQAGDADGIVLERPDGIKLWVPSRYFSAGQWYWITFYFYHPPAGHPFYGAHEEPVTAKLQFERLAELALGAGLWERARVHYEASVDLARKEGGDSLAAQYDNAYTERIKQFGWWRHPTEGRWIAETDYWTARGFKRWGKEWVPPEEWEKRERDRLAELAREIKIPDPAAYRRVSLALVRAFPGDFAPRKDPWKIRFYGRLVGPPEEKFPEAGKYKPGDWRRIRTLSDDCADIYIEKARKALLEKLATAAPATPVIVFGRLIVIEGRLLIEADEVVLR